MGETNCEENVERKRSPIEERLIQSLGLHSNLETNHKPFKSNTNFVITS
jgi:hypothetical protein